MPQDYCYIQIFTADFMHYKKFYGLNDDIVKIRTEVFIQEQGFKNELDDTDKTCTHIVLYDGKIPFAVCRYFKTGESYHIGRVAVDKKYRGKNSGRKIMLIAEKEILKEGGKLIEISAQLRVKDFYAKIGYTAVGDVYLDEYCPHIKMQKNI